MFSFKLPDIGEGIQEGEVTRWLKKEGDAVDEDEPFVEVMTDKATVELTSPKKGVLSKCYFKEGDVAKVGQVLADIDESAGAGTDGARKSAAKSEPMVQDRSKPSAPTTGVGATQPPQQPAAGPAPRNLPSPAPASTPTPSRTGQAGGTPPQPAEKITADAASAGSATPAGKPAEKAEKEEKTLFELPKETAAATKTIARRDGAMPSGAGSPGGGAGASGGSGTGAASGTHASQASPVPQVPAGYKATAAPAVRRFAREKNIDIHKVLGTGQNGRVTRDDIEQYVAATNAPAVRTDAAAAAGTPVGAAAGAAAAGGARFSYADVRYSSDASREERVPLRGLRRTIHKAMERSKFTATHFTYVAEVDCDKLVQLRDSAKGIAEEKGVKLTFLPIIVKAAVAALKRHPEVNVAFDENTQEIVRKNYWHIGVATATDAGLIVPVVKDADRKGILDIAREVADLSERTRAGKAKLDELSGSTFTITSLGKLGGVLATPILNYPEVAIMGVHEMKQVPVVKDGKIAIGWRMNLSFSFDHRVVDGYNGALFANTLIRYLEEPQLLLLETL